MAERNDNNVVLYDTNTGRQIKEPQQNIHQRENIFEILNTVTKKNNTLEKNVICDELKSGGPFSSEKKRINFAQAVSEEQREFLDLEKFFSEDRAAWQECVSAKAIVLSEQYVQENSKKKVLYLVFNKEGGGYSASLPTKTDLRKAMEDIWADIVFVERGKRYATICLGFKTKEDAEKQARINRETSTHFLVPEYGGRRNTRVGFRNISHDVNPLLVVTFAAQYGRVVEAEVIRRDMWAGGTRMQLQVLMSPKDHSSIPEICPVTGAETRALRLTVQGRKPSCYSCGSKSHLRAFCPEILERKRKGQRLPEAAPPVVPPTEAPAKGIPVEITMVEESEDPPPHTVDIQPVVEHEFVDPASTVVSEEEEDVADCPSSSTLSVHEHQDEQSMEAGDVWQVVGKGKGRQKRRKSRRSAQQPQSKTARRMVKGKAPQKKRSSPQRWGFTVLRKSNKDLMDEVKDLQKLLGEDQVLLGKQMGECYQQQAEDRRLVKTVQLCHQIMAERHGRDVGPFLPTITPELLRGPYGSPQQNDEDQGLEHESDTNVRRKIADIQRQPLSERSDQAGFTVVRARNDYSSLSIMEALQSFQRRGACVLVGDEMGPSYQQPAEGGELIVLPEYQYLMLLTDFAENMGNWLPTITPELLTDEFRGTPEEGFVRTEVNGLVSWVANPDDQG